MIDFSSNATAPLAQHVSGALKTLQENLSKRSYAFCDVLNDDMLLSEVESTAHELKKNFKNFVVLGTGGSSLGAKTLCDLTHNPFAIQHHSLHFLNNVDSYTIEQLLTGLDLEKTCFLSVSKSGSTAETLCQTLCVMTHLEAQGLDLKKHILVLTEDKISPLTDLAKTYQLKQLVHHHQIGGRFSVFSNVGLLPAVLMGVDIRKVHQGAWAYLEEFQQADASHPVVEGACRSWQGLNAGKNISVMMPYVDRLGSFAQWYAQLWAESLGKQGKGSTPIAALGTVDQHSQLQLYADGPDDKLYTFLIENSKGRGLVPHGHTGVQETLTYLDNQTMGDLLLAEARATVDSLKQVNRPVRVISFDLLNEMVLGELLVHFMLETMLTALLLDVDAFDQPGVEQSKLLTRQYLAEMKAL